MTLCEDEELAVAVAALDRAVEPVQPLEAQLGHQRADLLLHPGVQLRVAHDAAVAQPFAANLELRLDQA
ncbi:hypothetical protein D3C84_1301230 [compost metagenome]